MSAVKDQAIRIIQSLPDDCTFEDIQHHLEVRRKVERGLKEAEGGRFVTQEEAERRIAGWARSQKSPLDQLTAVYDGLTESEIDEIERIVLRRCNDRPL